MPHMYRFLVTTFVGELQQLSQNQEGATEHLYFQGREI